VRKLIVSNMVTLDGYFEGPNRQLDWHNVEAEFLAYANDLLNSVDTILFGRITYEMMASYWTDPEVIASDPIADKMNSLQKLVFSKTLDKLDWNNSILIKNNIADELIKRKEQPGKDIVIFGSGNIMSQLAKLGLIDEYRIIINPVILGSGHSMFKDIQEKINLELINTKTLGSGNVILYYQPVK
jgi:dihydrofolate reductase